jgi:hypothetical protein
MPGSLRVLSRNCLRGLALNGPLGAAMELEGGRSVPSADPSDCVSIKAVRLVRTVETS